MWLLVCTALDRQQIPARVYWNAEQGRWARFDQASRFDATTAPLPEPQWPGAEVAWMEDWPVDLDGFPYSTGEPPWRLTHCCGAGTSINDGPLYCRSCYEEVPPDYDTPPRLDANWQPGNGPIRIDLGHGQQGGTQRPARTAGVMVNMVAQPEPGTGRFTVLVVERFGQAQASVHDSPEQATARLHGLVVEDWNLDGPVPEDPGEAIRQYFAGLGHYADYALVPVNLGTATIDAGLAGLSRHVQPQQLPELEVFDGPVSLTSETLKVGQLSKLCPATGRPDQFRIHVAYTPIGGCCLEIDSLVRHLEAFHHVAISAEVLADQVAAAVLQATGAGRVEVRVHQTGREGADLHVTARHPADTPEQSAARPAQGEA